MRSIVPINPLFLDIDRMFDEDFPVMRGTFSPPIDVYQKKDALVVETPIPNVDPDKVEISVENDVLTVSGRTERKTETKREDYYRKEVREGSFSRSVILPMSVRSDQAEALYENGTLRITLPKMEEAKPKRIAIRAKSA